MPGSRGAPTAGVDLTRKRGSIFIDGTSRRGTRIADTPSGSSVGRSGTSSRDPTFMAEERGLRQQRLEYFKTLQAATQRVEEMCVALQKPKSATPLVDRSSFGATDASDGLPSPDAFASHEPSPGRERRGSSWAIGSPSGGGTDLSTATGASGRARDAGAGERVN